MRKVTVVFAILFATGRCSFDQPAEVATDLTEIQPELGDGHNEFTDEFVKSCLTMTDLEDGDIEVIPPKDTEMKFAYNLDRQSVRDAMKGNGAAKLNWGNLEASGDLAIENEVASDQLSSAMTIVYRAGKGRHQLTNRGLQKMKLGRKITGERSYSNKEKAERCGTHFLAGYELSASFIATLKFEFASETDKNRFDGHLKAAFKKFEIEGGLERDLTDVTDKANVSLAVFQRGGDASQVGKVLNDKITQCNAQNKTACLESMEGILNYLKTDFPDQFTNEETIDPRRFWFSHPRFEAYENIDPNFNGLKPTPEQRQALEQTRITLNDAFMQELRDKTRVRMLLQSGMVTSLVLRNKLFEAQRQLDDRMRALAEAIAPCYRLEEDIRPCIAAVEPAVAQELEMKSYQERLAELPVDYSLLSVQPTNFMEYCAQMKMWHTTYFGFGVEGAANHIPANPVAAEIDMDPDTRRTVSAMLNIPPITTFQDGRRFEAHLNQDVETHWSPMETEVLKKNGQAFWNCSALRDIVHDIEQEVNLANQKLRSIEPIVSFQNAFHVDVSDNRIRYGMSAVGKIEDLMVFKANNSYIKYLKGVRNENTERLELRNNKFDGEQLAFIAGAKALIHLDLRENAKVRSLEHLQQLPALEFLDLRKTGVTGETLTAWLAEGGGYESLGSQPTVYWDHDDCTKLVSSAHHGQRLECGE